jgi:ribosomal protein L24E
MAKSLVPRKNLMIIPADGKYRLVRKVYFHEFHNFKWRVLVRRRHHPRVLRWLKKMKRKELR